MGRRKVGLIFRPDLGTMREGETMSISSDTPRDNFTLSEADLAACRPLSVKVATCCGRYPFTAPTASAACGCRCAVAVSCALPVVPGAIWKQRGRSGVRSSSARRPSGGLQPAGSACHTVASRHLREQAASGSSQDALRRSPSTACARSRAA